MTNNLQTLLQRAEDTCEILLIQLYLSKLMEFKMPFLANVNYCSRSLYVIAGPSVVCLSVVCNVGAH